MRWWLTKGRSPDGPELIVQRWFTKGGLPDGQEPIVQRWFTKGGLPDGQEPIVQWYLTQADIRKGKYMCVEDTNAQGQFGETAKGKVIMAIDGGIVKYWFGL